MALPLGTIPQRSSPCSPWRSASQGLSIQAVLFQACLIGRGLPEHGASPPWHTWSPSKNTFTATHQRPCCYIGMWHLSFTTRNWTLTPCIGRQSLNHWTAKKSLSSFLPVNFTSHCVFQKRQFSSLVSLPIMALASHVMPSSFLSYPSPGKWQALFLTEDV